VHFVAGLRQLLEAAGDRVDCVSAFTAQLQDHLPPVDTINAILKTSSGVSGTFQQSAGTTLREDEWTVACEKGTITVNGSQVTSTVNGKVTAKSVPNERTGVPAEVRAWGEALAAGKVLKDQEPEAALADLEIVSYEF
jgi:GFO/IDH/MocA C-terminal domain